MFFKKFARWKFQIQRFRAVLEPQLLHSAKSDRTVFKAGVEVHTSLYGKINSEYRWRRYYAQLVIQSYDDERIKGIS